MSGPLPAAIDAELHRLAALWAARPMRPRLKPRIAPRWDALILAWSANEQLPLLIRKSKTGVARGEVILHQSGRELVPTENSPASWSLMMAYAGEVPTLTTFAAPWHPIPSRSRWLSIEKCESDLAIDVAGSRT